MKKILVCGAGGFIGSHLVRKLVLEGNSVYGVDLKHPEFSLSEADVFIIGDLRNHDVCENVLKNGFDQVYQLAADMGGAGFVFTGENDADIMHNSALINLNIAKASVKYKVNKLFYSSSACVYPEYNQLDPENPKCAEESAYPAYPDSEYGWEKLFSERIYFSFKRNYGLDVRIARFHNIFGPEGTWEGGREKAPAAICRKIAMAKQSDEIEIWGDGLQTRSFLYIDECLSGIEKLMGSESFYGPVNIGSDEMVTINKMAEITAKIANKNITLKHIEGPQGVRGRNSDNRLISEKLGWAPSMKLEDGLKITYDWICKQVELKYLKDL